MKSNKKTVAIANCLLLFATIIWGISFVAQDIAGKYLGTFAINAIRFFIGSVALMPVILIFNFRTSEKKTIFKSRVRPSVIGGIFCGIILFIACSLQQFGISNGTEPGKAGFLTAMYIIFVPIIGLTLRKPVTPFAWVAICIAPFGLYLLCVKSGFTLSISDLLLLLCALAYSFHILFIDRFSPKSDCILLSSVQFMTASILSAIMSAVTETVTLTMISDSMWSLLYLGIFSSGVGYTLQVIGQSRTNPTVASLLMSLESVFSVIFTAIILKKMLTARELAGCIIIFIAVILSQIPINEKRRKQK